MTFDQTEMALSAGLMPVVLEDIPSMPLRTLDTFTAGGVGYTARAAYVLSKTQSFKYMWQQ